MPTLGVFKINPSLVSHQLPVSPSLQNYLGKIFLACSRSSHTEPTGGVILYAASKSQRSEPGPAARGPRVGSSSRKRASGGHLAEYTGDTRRPRLTGVVFQPGRFSLLTGEKGEQAEALMSLHVLHSYIGNCLFASLVQDVIYWQLVEGFPDPDSWFPRGLLLTIYLVPLLRIYLHICTQTPSSGMMTLALPVNMLQISMPSSELFPIILVCT